MDVPSSPSKRSRVTFDPDVEVVSPDDEDDLDPALVREEVRRAIKRHLNGEDETYNRVKSIFTKDPQADNAPSTTTVRVHLQAVYANVSSLNKRCDDLVSAILFGEWVGRDEAYFSLYAKFVALLAAAQGGYLGRIMFALVELLGPGRTRRLPGCKVVRRQIIHHRVMRTIQDIVEKVPVASSTLAQVIQRKLSFDFEKPEERITYIKNFMLLIGFVPELKSEVLAMITSELVKLDVSVQADLDDEDDDLGDELLQDVLSSQTMVGETSQLSLGLDKLVEEEDDGSTTEESGPEDDEDVHPDLLRKRKLRDSVCQVDAVMDLLFQYYDELILSSLEVRESTIAQLIAQFENIILPTYRSRHPQFLIFHFAQTSPVTVDRFVTSCIQILNDKALPPVLRQSSAAYLAGFVGRGAHVSPTVVKDCFTMLCDDLNDLRNDIEPRCLGPDIKRYSTFYATMQAIMYIFCFRWRDLATASSDIVEDESGDEDEPDHFQFSDTIRETLMSAIHSKLNPLRVCTPAIVQQFAKITHQLGFMYVFTKIEANKHVRLTSSRTTVTDFGLNQPDRDLSWVGENGVMEGYFPYDPYHLPISRHWVEDDYLEWKGISEPNEEGSDSDDIEDDDLMADDLNEYEETATEESVE
jgi:RNA polymerase I-specific transcription initiation factor RRN3